MPACTHVAACTHVGNSAILLVLTLMAQAAGLKHLDHALHVPDKLKHARSQKKHRDDHTP